MSKMKICIDAGHGYDTPGKRTPLMPKNVDFDRDGTVNVKKGTTIREHVANAGVSMFLVRELERCGFDVLKSGFDDSNAKDDEDVSLTKRQLAIKQAECDYSISIHFNAFGDGKSFNSAEGVSIYIHNNYPRDSEALADKVLKQLIKGIHQKNRGIGTASLAMCNCLKMKTKASILVECAFMTNLNEAVNMMGNVDYWQETAAEIAKGICEYTDITYVTDSNDDDIKKGSTSSYRVQAGAFSNKLNADLLVEKLKVAGFKEANMYTTFISGKPLYRVEIGSSRSKAVAEKLLIYAKAAGFQNVFIQEY